jgi:hypothetical protein
MNLIKEFLDKIKLVVWDIIDGKSMLPIEVQTSLLGTYESLLWQFRHYEEEQNKLTGEAN